MTLFTYFNCVVNSKDLTLFFLGCGLVEFDVLKFASIILN